MAPRKTKRKPAKRATAPAGGYDLDLCKRGDHPPARRIGSACMACSKLDAWGKR